MGKGIWAVLMLASVACAMSVADLTDKNFTEFVESREVVMINFYSHECPHCKAYLPQYEEEAERMRHLGRPYHFGRINVGKEFFTSDIHSIRVLPTLRLFFEGKPVEPDYDREAPLLDFIDKLARSIHPSILLIQAEEIQERIKSGRLMCVLIGDDAASAAREIYDQVAAAEQAIEFYRASLELGRQAFKEMQLSEGSVVFLKPFDEQQAKMAAELTRANLVQFIEENRVPRVREFDQATVGQIMKPKGKAALVHFWKGAAEARHKEVFHSVATAVRDNDLLFISTDVKHSLAERIAKLTGVYEEDLPIIIGIQRESKGLEAFVFDEEVSEKNLREFVEQWRQGRGKRLLKSERVGGAFSQAVRKLVGRNYNSVFHIAGATSLVYHCAKEKDCVEFARVYESVHKQFRDRLQCYAIDLSRNELGPNSASLSSELKLVEGTDEFVFRGDLNAAEIGKFLEQHISASGERKPDL